MAVGRSINAPEKRSRIRSKTGDDLQNAKQARFDF